MVTGKARRAFEWGSSDGLAWGGASSSRVAVMIVLDKFSTSAVSEGGPGRSLEAFPL